MGSRTISYQSYFCDICKKIRAVEELTAINDIEICDVCL